MICVVEQNIDLFNLSDIRNACDMRIYNLLLSTQNHVSLSTCLISSVILKCICILIICLPQQAIRRVYALEDFFIISNRYELHLEPYVNKEMILLGLVSNEPISAGHHRHHWSQRHIRHIGNTLPVSVTGTRRHCHKS